MSKQDKKLSISADQLIERLAEVIWEIFLINNQNNMKNYKNPDWFNEKLIENYVLAKFKNVKRQFNEYVVECPFIKHEHDSTAPAFNIHRSKGVFYCFKCQASGNLFKLAKHFGDNLKDFK